MQAQSDFECSTDFFKINVTRHLILFGCYLRIVCVLFSLEPRGMSSWPAACLSCQGNHENHLDISQLTSIYHSQIFAADERLSKSADDTLLISKRAKIPSRNSLLLTLLRCEPIFVRFRKELFSYRVSMTFEQ